MAEAEIDYKALCTEMSGDLIAALTRLLLLGADINEKPALGQQDMHKFFRAYELVGSAYPDITLPPVPGAFHQLRQLALDAEPWLAHFAAVARDKTSPVGQIGMAGASEPAAKG